MIPFLTFAVMIVFQDRNTAIFIGILRQVIGFFLTLGLWKIYQRWPSDKFSFVSRAWQIALCCLVATGIDVALAEMARNLVKLPELPELALVGSLFLRTAIYVAWSALYFVIRQELAAHDTALRLARLEAANREAELQLLRAQMNPHFIFNALNSIIGEAADNPAAVIETTHAVADYLRYSLSQRSHRAPLGNELAAMTSYLHVERSNYGEKRLVWEINATDEARVALAPTALIQPLIENAIKYGIRTSPSPLQLRVNATVENDELLITVENSGRWIARTPGEAPDSTGIGLNNVRRRLSLLCGDHARLSVQTPNGCVQVQARLPLNFSEEISLSLHAV